MDDEQRQANYLRQLKNNKKMKDKVMHGISRYLHQMTILLLWIIRIIYIKVVTKAATAVIYQTRGLSLAISQYTVDILFFIRYQGIGNERLQQPRSIPLLSQHIDILKCLRPLVNRLKWCTFMTTYQLLY